MESIKDDLKNIIDVSAIITKTDTNGKIVYVNDKFCEVSGYKREELIGNMQNIVRHPDMPKSVFKELWITIQDGMIWHGIIKNKRKDGSYYYVRNTIYPITDGNDIVREYMGVCYPITEEVIKEKAKNKKLIDTKTSFVRQNREQISIIEAELIEAQSKLKKMSHTIAEVSKKYHDVTNREKNLIDNYSDKMDKAFEEIDKLKKEIAFKERQYLIQVSNIQKKEKELGVKNNNLAMENNSLKNRISGLVAENQKLKNTIQKLQSTKGKITKAIEDNDNDGELPTYKSEEKNKRVLSLENIFDLTKV